MLEMNAASVQHQLAANMPEGRQAIHASGAHLSNTTLDDFMLEERPRRESTLHFDNLPDGLRYQELFELCAQYVAPLRKQKKRKKKKRKRIA